MPPGRTRGQVAEPPGEGAPWTGLPRLISGREAQNMQAEGPPFIFTTSPPAWMKGPGRGWVAVVMSRGADEERRGRPGPPPSPLWLPRLLLLRLCVLSPSFPPSPRAPPPPSLFPFFSRPCLFLWPPFKAGGSSALCAGMLQRRDTREAPLGAPGVQRAVPSPSYPELLSGRCGPGAGLGPRASVLNRRQGPALGRRTAKRRRTRTLEVADRCPLGSERQQVCWRLRDQGGVSEEAPFGRRAS